MKPTTQLITAGICVIAVAVTGLLWFRHQRAEAEFYSFERIRAVSAVKPYDDVRWKDLSGLDLSGNPELIPTLWLNEKTVWPNPSRMPSGVEPGVILTNGMDSGLGVRELHRQGITGKGVIVAVIDAPTDFDHPEYRRQVIQATSIGADVSVSMHGPSVLSLLVGDRCGTAPGAKVYYVASSNVTEAVDWILEQNRRLPSEGRIRAVSVSQEQDEKWRETCERAEAENLLIVDLNQVHGWVAPCQLGKDREDPGQCTRLESRN
jgi:serine protease AprX